LFLLVAMATGGAGAAADAVQSPLPAQSTIVRAAGCLLSADRTGSRALSQAAPASDAERAAWIALAPQVQRCFGRAGLADSEAARSLVAGQLAERLYVGSTTYFESRVVSKTTVPAGAPTLQQAASNRTQGWPAEAAMAECVVLNAPNEVDRLLRTGAGSGAEAQAIGIVRSAFPSCVNQGQQIALNRRQLRAELARAFFRYINPIAGPLLSGRPH
jgi:hypothetical protein